jgi:NADPH-dependent 2,4-dienoyl-CoA reductase/sulfur reductase-like enzyme
MQTLSRRHFLKLTAATSALAASPRFSTAQSLSTRRVIVVGGGFGGATAAKYLRHWGGPAVAVTLVEKNPSHVSCILSNLVMNGSLDLQKITFNYEALKTKYGVHVVQGQAVGVNGKQLQLSNGATLGFDRLIVAPGIDFDFRAIGVQDPANLLHAWQAGPQTLQLRDQLKSLKAGNHFVLTIPPAPYRCPPGPYERACLVADYLKKNKRGSKVIVLDANPGIVAEKETFTKAFTQTHAGIVEYHPGVIITSVNAQAKTISYTENGVSRTLTPAVTQGQVELLNVLPPQTAGKLAFDLGLVPAGQKWAPVNPLSYESTLAPGIHVIGDAQSTPKPNTGSGQPKSGHIANAEAKVCIDAILRAFAGEAPDPAPMTNSACYSPITASTASWLTAVFAYDPNNNATMVAVPASAGEAPTATSDHYEHMFDWAANLFADTFG